MYNPIDNEANIKNGYMLENKNRFIGFCLVFGFGAPGALYYGFKHALELFWYQVAMIICMAIGIFMPVAHIGTFCFGGVMLIKCFSLVFGNDSYELTPEGVKAHKEWQDKAHKEVKADFAALTAKTVEVVSEMKENFIKHVEKAEPQNSEASMYCHDCGIKVHLSAKFCTGCGIKMEKVA